MNKKNSVPQCLCGKKLSIEIIKDLEEKQWQKI
jgi:hypothetical protein